MIPSLKKCYFLILLFLTSLSLAQNQSEEKKLAKPVPDARAFVTNHQGTFGGKPIRYKATAKETYLKDTHGDPVASIWSVAYTQEGVTDFTKRPVTFIFNGGFKNFWSDDPFELQAIHHHHHCHYHYCRGQLQCCQCCWSFFPSFLLSTSQCF